MRRSKEVTIHKKNELARGQNSYSLQATRALNVIYWAYQKYELVGHKGFVPISFKTLRKLMKLEKDNRYIDVIKEALIELKQPIELNNFTHPITEKKYQWYATTYLNDVGFRKDENGEYVADIEISTIVRYVMGLKGNFTFLKLMPYLNKFKTKYAMKLYEYLKSFGAYGYIEVSQKHMMFLLNLDEQSTYRHYSKLHELIERQLNEIREKSDMKEVKLIKSKSYAKEKIYRIMLTKNGKKKAVSDDETIAKATKSILFHIHKF